MFSYVLLLLLLLLLLLYQLVQTILGSQSTSDCCYLKAELGVVLVS